MNWDDLRFFLAVAQQGSLAGAARVLGVNHSTAYRRLKSLEDNLEVRLFERHAEGYVMTTAGADIVDLATRIDEDFMTLERKLAGRDFALSGRVRLTTAPNFAHAYLPALLSAFSRRYPKIAIELSVSDSDYDLRRREADLALRATPEPPDFLIGRLVARLPWFACASNAYLSQHGRPQRSEQLSDHALIGADDRFERLPVFAWARSSFSDQAMRFRCNDLTTMACLAEQDVGIAFLPGDLVRPGLIRLFEVCPQASGQLWLLTHPDLRRVTRVRVVMRFLAQQLAQDPRLKPFAMAPPPA